MNNFVFPTWACAAGFNNNNNNNNNNNLSKLKEICTFYSATTNKVFFLFEKQTSKTSKLLQTF